MKRYALLLMVLPQVRCSNASSAVPSKPATHA